jgi:hypothetical protein
LAFSISAGKETRYLLPVLPAWAMLLAWGWVRARARGRFVGWHAGLARVARLATWILPVGWLIAGWVLYPEDRAAVIASAALGLVARVAFAAGARSRRPAIALASVALAVLAGRLAWAGTSVAVDRRAAPLHEIGRAVEARVPPGEPFVFLGKYKSYWGFAVRRTCIAVQDWGALAAAMGQPGVRRSSCVLVPEASLPAEVGSAAVLERWVVEGSPYALVDWKP